MVDLPRADTAVGAVPGRAQPGHLLGGGRAERSSGSARPAAVARSSAPRRHSTSSVRAWSNPHCNGTTERQDSKYRRELDCPFTEVIMTFTLVGDGKTAENVAEPDNETDAWKRTGN